MPTRYEYKLNAEFLVQILKIEHFIFKKIACGALGFLKASAFMDTGSKCYTFREPDPYASQPDGNVHFAFVLRDPSTHPKRPRRVVSMIGCTFLHVECATDFFSSPYHLSTSGRVILIKKSFERFVTTLSGCHVYLALSLASAPSLCEE